MSNQSSLKVVPPTAGHLTLRVGCPVDGSDDELGVLADIVVDPIRRVVTHVVVEPEHRHVQARLVPIGRVTAADHERATVDLDRDGLRELPRFGLRDFVPLGGPVDVGDDWEIASEHVALLPYWATSFLTGATMLGELTDVQVDRVPRGECEIRRASPVRDRLGRTLGHVDGLVVDGDAVTGVVLRRRLAGLHHLVAVPIAHVTAVTNDEIVLDLDRGQLARLPRPDAEQAPSPDSIPSPLEARLSVLLHRVVSALGSIGNAVRRRSGSAAPDEPAEGGS